MSGKGKGSPLRLRGSAGIGRRVPSNALSDGSDLRGEAAAFRSQPLHVRCEGVNELAAGDEESPIHVVTCRRGLPWGVGREVAKSVNNQRSTSYAEPPDHAPPEGTVDLGVNHAVLWYQVVEEFDPGGKHERWPFLENSDEVIQPMSDSRLQASSIPPYFHRLVDGSMLVHETH